MAGGFVKKRISNREFAGGLTFTDQIGVAG
jgi:hypothetical protein